MWQHATVLAFTDKIYAYELTEESQREVKSTYFQGKVNYITYVVSRSTQLLIGNRVLHQYPVKISYRLEADKQSENFNTLLTRLETIDTLVVSELGHKWDATVDFYRTQEGPIEVSQGKNADDRPFWLATYTYTGFKHQALA